MFFPFERLGRWWDKQNEIDIVGVSSEANSLLFDEVKWSRKRVGENVYLELKKKAEKVKWGDTRTHRYYVLFSKNGFTNGMLSLAKKEKEGVFLFQRDKRIL